LFLLAVHGHQGLLHGRAVGCLAVLDRINLAARDDEVLAGFQDLALGDEVFAIGGRQQVQLEFDGQHVGALGHQGQSGIAAGAVDDGAGDAGVEEAVLLGQVGAEGQPDFAVAGAQRAHFGADQAHHALPREAAANVRLPVGIARLERVSGGAGGMRHSGSFRQFAHRS
jgi:hypothetical protein